jgi:hypothetical protein
MVVRSTKKLERKMCVSTSGLDSKTAQETGIGKSTQSKKSIKENKPDDRREGNKIVERKLKT